MLGTNAWSQVGSHDPPPYSEADCHKNSHPQDKILKTNAGFPQKLGSILAMPLRNPALSLAGHLHLDGHYPVAAVVV